MTVSRPPDDETGATVADGSSVVLVIDDEAPVRDLLRDVRDMVAACLERRRAAA